MVAYILEIVIEFPYLWYKCRNWSNNQLKSIYVGGTNCCSTLNESVIGGWFVEMMIFDNLIPYHCFGYGKIIGFQLFFIFDCISEVHYS